MIEITLLIKSLSDSVYFNMTGSAFPKEEMRHCLSVLLENTKKAEQKIVSYMEQLDKGDVIEL